MYATAADLTSWLPGDGSVPVPAAAEANRLLDRAAELVDDYVTSGYAVDATGAPAAAAVVDALRDATCAQVEQWLAVGEANDIEGRSGAVSSHGLSMDSYPDRLAPRARRALARAGLIRGVAW